MEEVELIYSVGSFAISGGTFDKGRLMASVFRASFVRLVGGEMHSRSGALTFYKLLHEFVCTGSITLRTVSCHLSSAGCFCFRSSS